MPVPIGDGPVIASPSGQPSSSSSSPSATPRDSSDEVVGCDISKWQAGIDMNQVKAWGASFCWIKATEGTTYKSDAFSDQYIGATAAGLLRGTGGYHFANPLKGSGKDQATFFHENGGGWTDDGQTLPGMLDVEYNPYKDDDGTNSCFGLSASAMVSWIKDFVETYHDLTTRYPMIYTTKDWWTTCTGDSTAFSANSPLHLAGTKSMFGGWKEYTLYQSLLHKIDWNKFNGDLDDLKKLAKGDGSSTRSSSSLSPKSTSTTLPTFPQTASIPIPSSILSTQPTDPGDSTGDATNTLGTSISSFPAVTESPSLANGGGASDVPVLGGVNTTQWILLGGMMTIIILLIGICCFCSSQHGSRAPRDSELAALGDEDDSEEGGDEKKGLLTLKLIQSKKP